MAADFDNLSIYFGPSAFVTTYRTAFHSFAAALLIALLVTLPFLFFKNGADQKRLPLLSIFSATLAAAVFHLLLDVCQSEGVELLWPFSTRRFALDWIAHLDFWIFGVLLAAILLPKLATLVTEEIGAKAKGPRGRFGAFVALSAIVLYGILRLVLHGDAIAALQARIYRGEFPRKVAALPEAGSPFRWTGVVETESALHALEVRVGPVTAAGAALNPESGVTAYKPQPSPILDAARDTDAARRFLQIARFPKATLEKTPTGYHVSLREFPYSNSVRGNADKSNSNSVTFSRYIEGLHVRASIDTDPAGKIVFEELLWDLNDLH
jgi:membrane-bound metal-dependent hydrolase YbcI (DUF457 family)